MLLSKILKDCKKDIEFKKTAVDSRKVEKGDLFAVLPVRRNLTGNMPKMPFAAALLPF